MKGKVLTSFHIVDMQRFVKADINELNLPKSILVAMFSISFSNTRALKAKASMGSRYTNLYLPLINHQEMLDNPLQSKD